MATAFLNDFDLAAPGYTALANFYTIINAEFTAAGWDVTAGNSVFDYIYRLDGAGLRCGMTFNAAHNYLAITPLEEGWGDADAEIQRDSRSQYLVYEETPSAVPFRIFSYIDDYGFTLALGTDKARRVVGTDTDYSTEAEAGDVIYDINGGGSYIGEVETVIDGTNLILSNYAESIINDSVHGKISEGTATVEVDSTDLVGVGCNFSSDLWEGASIYTTGGTLVGTVNTITDNDNIVLDAGATVALDGDYFLVAFSGTGTITGDYTVNIAHFGKLQPGILDTSVFPSEAYSDYNELTGVVTITEGSTSVTGSGTSFDTEVRPGYKLYNSEYEYCGTVSSVEGAEALTLTANSEAEEPGTTGEGLAFVTYKLDQDVILAVTSGQYSDSAGFARGGIVLGDGANTKVDQWDNVRINHFSTVTGTFTQLPVDKFGMDPSIKKITFGVGWAKAGRETQKYGRTRDFIVASHPTVGWRGMVRNLFATNWKTFKGVVGPYAEYEIEYPTGTPYYMCGFKVSPSVPTNDGSNPVKDGWGDHNMLADRTLRKKNMQIFFAIEDYDANNPEAGS